MREDDEFDVVVIGAGSAAESLVRELRGPDVNVAVVEARRVGGECPFTACMPSEAMLHDAGAGTSWRDAVDRRWEVVEQPDDTEHAHDLEKHGTTLLRGSAWVEDAHTVSVGTRMVSTKHLVLATGSEAVVSPIEGLHDLGSLRWTSTEALATDARPQRLLVLGGGVIGMELAQMYAGFGTHVTLVDTAAHGFPDLIPAIGQLVDAALITCGVSVRRGVELLRGRRRADEVHAEFDDGSESTYDRLLVAPLSYGFPSYSPDHVIGAPRCQVLSPRAHHPFAHQFRIDQHLPHPIDIGVDMRVTATSCSALELLLLRLGLGTPPACANQPRAPPLGSIVAREHAADVSPDDRARECAGSRRETVEQGPEATLVRRRPVRRRGCRPRPPGSEIARLERLVHGRVHVARAATARVLPSRSVTTRMASFTTRRHSVLDVGTGVRARSAAPITDAPQVRNVLAVAIGPT